MRDLETKKWILVLSQNINETEELRVVKLNMVLLKEEVAELRKEKIQLKAHNARRHAGYEQRLMKLS